MKINPLHTAGQINRYMLATGDYWPTERCTGRSTAQALRYLAEAIENPHTPVKIMDHESIRRGGMTSIDRYLMSTMQEMVRKLGMEHMLFSMNNTVTFTR